MVQGLLFKYGPAACNTAFLTARHKRHVVFVGGLTDGLLAVQWVSRLAERLDGLQWSLVQPLLSSSYNQWGMESLDHDAEELVRLARHLKAEHGSQVC